MNVRSLFPARLKSDTTISVSARQLAAFVALGVSAAVLLAVLSHLTGLISENKGLGFDGEHYARMIEVGFKRGTPSMRLRPVVLLINDEVNYHVFHDPLATFRAMNLVYAGALAIVLGALCRRYGGSPATAAILVLNLFLCISIAKMFAFYPTLIDLGAYVFVAAATWAVVSGRRLWIVVTSVLAVLSREFGAVVVLFGIARDLRLRRSVPTMAATYVPAVIAFFWIRTFASSYSTGAEVNEPVLSAGGLVAALVKNVEWWRDPLYILFWVYFIATLFGGVSLALLTTTRPLKTCVREEPEWLAMIVPLLLVAALGYIDTWRYAAFLVPAVPPFWAWAVSGTEPRRRMWLFAVVSLATIATQRPWQQMDLPTYFRDWFPYYVVIKDRAAALDALWSVWRTHIVVAVVSLVAIALVGKWATAERPSRGMTALPHGVE